MNIYRKKIVLLQLLFKAIEAEQIIKTEEKISRSVALQIRIRSTGTGKLGETFTKLIGSCCYAVRKRCDATINK